MWPRPPLQKEINITPLYLASLIPSKFWKWSSKIYLFIFIIFLTKTAKSIWKSSYPLVYNHTSDYSWYFGQKQGWGVDFFRQTNCPSQDIQCVVAFNVFFFMFESIHRPLGGVLSIRESPGWLWGWENVTWMHKEVTTHIRNPKVRQSTTWVKLIYQKATWVRGEVYFKHHTQEEKWPHSIFLCLNIIFSQFQNSILYKVLISKELGSTMLCCPN